MAESAADVSRSLRRLAMAGCCLPSGAAKHVAALVEAAEHLTDLDLTGACTGRSLGVTLALASSQ